MINNLIKSEIVPTATESDSRAFFLKMIGDYCRYIAESATGDKLQECKDQASKSYAEAQEIATSSLHECNSIRLGLALNYSVFFYEVMSDRK